VRRPRAIIAVAVTVVALVLTLAACGGGDDEEETTTPAPTEARSGTATPPRLGALPPELLECFADKGFDIESSADIHSAPPQVVQECFGALHQGGAVVP
jgi:hypothetical protein